MFTKNILRTQARIGVNYPVRAIRGKIWLHRAKRVRNYCCLYCSYTTFPQCSFNCIWWIEMTLLLLFQVLLLSAHTKSLPIAYSPRISDVRKSLDKSRHVPHGKMSGSGNEKLGWKYFSANGEIFSLIYSMLNNVLLKPKNLVSLITLYWEHFYMI